jgi:hypothetical protein
MSSEKYRLRGQYPAGRLSDALWSRDTTPPSGLLPQHFAFRVPSSSERARRSVARSLGLEPLTANLRIDSRETADQGTFAGSLRVSKISDASGFKLSARQSARNWGSMFCWRFRDRSICRLVSFHSNSNKNTYNIALDCSIAEWNGASRPSGRQDTWWNS